MCTPCPHAQFTNTQSKDRISSRANLNLSSGLLLAEAGCGFPLTRLCPALHISHGQQCRVLTNYNGVPWSEKWHMVSDAVPGLSPWSLYVHAVELNTRNPFRILRTRLWTTCSAHGLQSVSQNMPRTHVESWKGMTSMLLIGLTTYGSLLELPNLHRFGRHHGSGPACPHLTCSGPQNHCPQVSLHRSQLSSIT